MYQISLFWPKKTYKSVKETYKFLKNLIKHNQYFKKC